MQPVEKPVDNPVVHLLRQRLNESGLTARDVMERILLRHGGSRSKVGSRIHSLLRGEYYSDEYARRIAAALEVPEDQFEVALEAYYKALREYEEWEKREYDKRTMARRGPHLWAVPPPGGMPNLISIIGPEAFFLVRLPPEITDLPEFEQFQEVGRIAREHYQNEQRPLKRIACYHYRQSLDHIFVFSVEGELIERLKDTHLGPIPIVWLGGQKFEGSLFSTIYGGTPRIEDKVDDSAC